MMDIYYGRENIDKERFVFDRIGPKSVIIVPDQYALQAEREAFHYTGLKGLMDIEVLSFSRLADRVLEEAGKGRLSMIDRRGRAMLLARIMNDLKDELDVYARYRRNANFIDMANNMISELKQYDVTPEDLGGIEKEIEGSPLLSEKLSEIKKIYTAYAERIDGHYTDTEDRMNLFAAEIKNSSLVRESEIWIYGFDVFSPKNLKVITELVRYSKNVSCVMTYDENDAGGLFDVTGDSIDRLVRAAEDANVRAKSVPIRGYERKAPAATSHIEKNLYAPVPKSFSGDAEIRMVKASSIYNEAETAAAFVRHLVRDEGYRYRDILIICNDLAERGAAYRRVFGLHNIELFCDEKRSIAQNPAAVYLLAVTEIFAGGYRSEDIIRMLKTGLGGLSDDETSRLENYALEFKTRGAAWKKPFEKGAKRLGAETLMEIEELRAKALDPILVFHERYKKERTVEGKVRSLYDFLIERGIPEMLENAAKEQEEAARLESASETAQVWNMMMRVLDQMIEITGDETITAENFALMLRSGLEAVEIGLIPPAVDGVIMGTMQRTRTSGVRAVLVLGACDGVLPADISGSGFLSEDEKNRLIKTYGAEISKTDRLRTAEENMAIYRNLSKAKDILYISYAAADMENGKARPSIIYDRLKKMFSGVAEDSDILTHSLIPEAGQESPGSISPENAYPLIDTPLSTMNHAEKALLADEPVQEEWQAVMGWYRDNAPEKYRRVASGYLHEGSIKPIDPKLAKELYKKGDELVLSASRLEKFGGCPFEHFAEYGLGASERNEYTVNSLDIGTIFHECMRRVGDELTVRGTDITDPESPWMTVSFEKLDEMVGQIVRRIAAEYDEGLMHSGSEEAYRLLRIEKVCCESVHAMVKHVRAGNIESMSRETSFGVGGDLRPIRIKTQMGEILVEGKIDRLDALPGKRARVIDYKSGNKRFSIEEAEAGWQLQLSLYLRAAKGSGYTPSGMYYFKIQDPELDFGKIKGEIEQKIGEEFRMDGIMAMDAASDADVRLKKLNGARQSIASGGDAEICAETAEEKEESSWPTTEIKAKNDGEPDKNSMWKIQYREDFDDLLDRIYEKVDEMCARLAKGEIAAHPKRLKDGSRKKCECDYCLYRGICKFDTRFSGCDYDRI